MLRQTLIHARHALHAATAADRSASARCCRSGRAGVRLLRVREFLAWRAQGEDTCCPQVLHKFLEVFSCFDWDRYCLSLRGPIALDSFPNPVGVRPSAREWPAHVCACQQQDLQDLRVHAAATSLQTEEAHCPHIASEGSRVLGRTKT